MTSFTGPPASRKARTPRSHRGRISAVSRLGLAATLVVTAALAVATASLTARAAAASVRHGDSAEPEQEATARGRVVDRFARPISKVEVSAEGTRAVTDEDGAFELVTPATVLRFDHPQYLPLEVPVARAIRSDVVLTHVGEISETVLVAGSPLGDRFSPHSVTTSIVEVADRVISVASLSEAATSTAGVSENGQGGLFQVLSIRGISGQRILGLLAGARLTSERRAGVAASFVDPQLLGQVEVVRGPASTYHGSGALGGAFLIAPKRFTRGEALVEWGSEADANAQVFGWGNESWSLGLARRATGNGRTPSGLRLFDRFEQLSATLTRDFEAMGQRWNLLLLPSVGRDIGKPNADDPERRTLYPTERHLLVRLGVEDPDARWSANAWVHPQQLVTRVERLETSLSVVESDSFDLGLSWQHVLPELQGVSGRVSVEYFGRRGVRLEEEVSSYIGSGSYQSQEVNLSLSDAESDELAALIVVNGRLGPLRWETGGRFTAHRQDDRGVDQVTREALTGFVGAALPLGSRLELVGNIGRGLRVPTLSERFFVGSTGRGQVVGQPDLEPEESLNLELGLRISLPRGYVLAQAFSNRVDDYIERIEVGEGVRSFRNLTSGTIQGVEAESVTQFTPALRLGLGAQWLEGESDTGAPLADVPQGELKATLGYERGRWRGSLRARWRDEKNDPGPSEVRLEDALVADAGVEMQVSPGVSIVFSGRNLLDEDYLPSADDKAVPARRRSLSLGLRLGLQ